MGSTSFEALLIEATELDKAPLCVDYSTLGNNVWAHLANNEQCIFQGTGDIFLGVAETLAAAFSQLVVNNARVGQYIDEQLKMQGEKDDLQDLHNVKYMGDKHRALKNLNNTLRNAVTQMRLDWEESPTAPPLPQPLRCILPTSDHFVPRSGESLSTLKHTSQTQIVPPVNEYDVEDVPPRTVPLSRETDEPEPDDQNTCEEDRMQEVIRTMIEDLQRQKRGKGGYKCPLKANCTRKGVRPDGTLEVFDRNSAFKAHLQKHQKMFKCPLPGCKNTEGFARPDQLHRHRTETKYHGRVDTTYVENAKKARKHKVQSAPRAQIQLRPPPVVADAVTTDTFSLDSSPTDVSEQERRTKGS